MLHTLKDSLMGALKANETDTVAPYGQSNYLSQIVTMDDPVYGGGEFIYGLSPASNITGETISSITYSGTTATVTTAAAHALLPGALVTLSGQTASIYSGTYTILTVPSTTTFTYTLSGTPTANATVVGTYIASPIMVGQFLEYEITTVSGVRRIGFRRWQGTANTGKN